MPDKSLNMPKMSAVKSAIKKGGKQMGGNRMGPAAPNMRKNPFSAKKGK